MYNDIKLDKTMYNISGKSFSAVLSNLDPDENYADTPLRGLDAFERQLKRFDIKISGNDCDTVSRFFTTSESAVLFPEFIRRQIKQGFIDTLMVDKFAASVINIDDNIYSVISVADDHSTSVVYEGDEMDLISVTTSSSAASKFAKALKISYESIKQKRIDTFAVLLRQLGMSIAKCVNANLVPMLGEMFTESVSVKESEFSYDTLVDFWKTMTNFDMDTILCSKKQYAKILEFSEIKNQISTGVNTDKSCIKTPFGVTIMPVSGLDSDNYYGFSSRYCYELVKCSDLIVETGKLITLQFDEIAASITMGASKINPSAALKLSVTA